MKNFKDYFKQKGLYLGKYNIIRFGEYQEIYALGLSYEHIQKMETVEEILEYLEEIFDKVPQYFKYLDFQKLKKDLSENLVEELDLLLGQDFEDGGDSGYGSYIATNRKILLYTKLSHGGGSNHYFKGDSTEIPREKYFSEENQLRDLYIIKNISEWGKYEKEED